jgi:hypothetical protein
LRLIIVRFNSRFAIAHLVSGAPLWRLGRGRGQEQDRTSHEHSNNDKGRGADGSLKTLNATTSEDCSFSASIRLEKASSYTITASYAGSELYEPSTASAVVEARVSPTSPLLIPETLRYIVVVAVVVVGIIIAVLKAPRSARKS